MDTGIVKGLIDDVIRLSIELNEVKKERDEYKHTHEKMLADFQEMEKLLKMYSDEARKEVDTGLVISAIMTNMSKESAIIVNNEEDIKEVNIVEAVVDVVEDPVEAKKAKRKEYMKQYMREKRQEKQKEKTAPSGRCADVNKIQDV